MFGWTLRHIFPKDDDAWFKKIRRRIYYPILNSWSDYNRYAVLDTFGHEVKITMTGFITWRALLARTTLLEGQLIIRAKVKRKCGSSLLDEDH